MSKQLTNDEIMRFNKSRKKEAVKGTPSVNAKKITKETKVNAPKNTAPKGE